MTSKRAPVLLAVCLLTAAPAHALPGEPAASSSSSAEEVAVVADDDESPPPAETQDERPEWDGLNRAHGRLRGALGIHRNGVAPMFSLDLGIEHIGRSGFLFGLRMPQLSLVGSGFAVDVGLLLGYGSEYFAIAVELGAGYPALFRFGARARIGAEDRFCLKFGIGFSLLFLAIPTEGDLDLIMRVHRRVAVELSADWHMFPAMLLSGTAGVQVYLRGDGLRGTTLLRFAAGAGGVLLSTPAAVASVGVEHRW